MKTPKTNRNKYETRDLERFAANIAAWVEQGKRWATEGDQEMAKSCERDAADLKAIHAAVEQGDYRKALKLARRLDTVVRDEIPVRLYNAIHRERS